MEKGKKYIYTKHKTHGPQSPLQLPVCTLETDSSPELLDDSSLKELIFLSPPLSLPEFFLLLMYHLYFLPKAQAAQPTNNSELNKLESVLSRQNGLPKPLQAAYQQFVSSKQFSLVSVYLHLLDFDLTLLDYSMLLPSCRACLSMICSSLYW